MTWYRGFYGSWRDLSFRRLPYDTNRRRDIFRLAREAASSSGKVVTVIGERRSSRGIDLTAWKVLPGGEITLA